MFNSFKRTALLSLVLVLFVSALALTAAVPAAKAQDGGTTCDSTTVLLTYLAQHLGFRSTALDINTFELGQFRSYFDMMNAGPAGQGGQTSAGQAGQAGDQGQTGQAGQAGDQGQAGDTGQAGDQGQAGDTGQAGDQGQAGDAGQAGEQGQAGDTGQAGDQGQAGTILLMPATVANEDPVCTQLRQEVESFLFAELQGGRLGTDRFGMGAQGQMDQGGQSSQSGQDQSGQMDQSESGQSGESMATEEASGANG